MSEQSKQDSVPNMRHNLFSVGAEMVEQSESLGFLKKQWLQIKI